MSTPYPTPPAMARRPFIDPGWLFLIAGLGILGATVLIPASRDLDNARWQRDRALAVETHRQQRLARYEEYLAAVDSRDPTVVLSLAESQLNQIPVDRAPIPRPVGTQTDVSVFPSLEPPALQLPAYQPKDSILLRWTTDDSTRIWLILGGAVSVLIGLLPPSRGWSTPRTPAPQV